MRYVVVCDFADSQDNNHVYRAGDAFPRLGAEAGEARIAELAGSNNRIGRPLIEASKRKKKANADSDLSISEELVQPKTRRK